MIKQNPAKWIAVTAMGVALVVVAQFLGSRIPSIATIFGPFSVQQLITGTLVNCILLVFTARAGIASGAVIGVLSSLLAAFFGISQVVVTPMVAIGNALLCVVYGLLARRPRCAPGPSGSAAPPPRPRRPPPPRAWRSYPPGGGGRRR